MLQNVMQNTGRMVARDPALRIGGILFILSLIIGPTVILPFIAPSLLTLIEPLSGFTGASITYMIIYALRALQWKKLEKKRQQAAFHNFMNQQQVPIPPFAASLPARLVISMQRRWSATYIGGIFYAFAILFSNLILYSLWQNYVQKIIDQKQAPGWILYGTIACLVPLCLLNIAAVIGLIYAPRQQLIATQDGLICRLGYRFRYIPWHEARLFAVIGQVKDALVYELASDSQIIRWVSKPVASSGYSAPFGVLGLTDPLSMAQAYPSKEAYEQDVQTLSAMIMTRTRQPLHDLR